MGPLSLQLPMNLSLFQSKKEKNRKKAIALNATWCPGVGPATQTNIMENLIKTQMKSVI